MAADSAGGCERGPVIARRIKRGNSITTNTAPGFQQTYNCLKLYMEAEVEAEVEVEEEEVLLV